MGCNCLFMIIELNNGMILCIPLNRLKGKRIAVYYELVFKICFFIAYFNAQLPALFQNSRPEDFFK